MNVTTLCISVLTFLLLFQETSCLNSKSTFFPLNRTYCDWWDLSTPLVLIQKIIHIHIIRIVQRYTKHLMLLECTNSLPTQTKNVHLWSLAQKYHLQIMLHHVRYKVVESKKSAGIFSLTAIAQGFSIHKTKSCCPSIFIRHKIEFRASKSFQKANRTVKSCSAWFQSSFRNCQIFHKYFFPHQI